MISSQHGLLDDRIYWKESLSLRKSGYQVIHVGTGDTDSDHITGEGIRIIQVRRIRYFRNPYMDFFYRKVTFRRSLYKKMFRICAGIRAQVYHLHDIQINKIGLQLKRLPHAPRVIYDVHEDFSDLFLTQFPNPGPLRLFFRLYATWLNRWERKHAASYDHVIAAVDHIAAKFKSVLSGQSISVIYNYTTLLPEKIKPFAEKKFDAIYCGQINMARGALQILEAVKLLKTGLPGIRILMLGPIPETSFRQKLERLIAEYRLTENVILYGSVPYNEISDYYQDSRIGLGIFLPVSIFYYGIQIKTFEYMAYGLPVVCSNFGHIARVISETGSGVAIDPLSPGEIAEALKSLLTDKNMYARMSEAGRKAVQQVYNWSSEEGKLISLYHRLLRVD
jgi:glycosyltransferase involved in cell wall biosynthesis